MATYGPDIVLSQDNLTMKVRLQLLSLLQPAVEVLKERFVRRCNSIYSPEKVYEHTLILSGDIKQAEVNRAWQKLNQMDS